MGGAGGELAALPAVLAVLPLRWAWRPAAAALAVLHAAFGGGVLAGRTGAAEALLGNITGAAAAGAEATGEALGVLQAAKRCHWPSR